MKSKRTSTTSIRWLLAGGLVTLGAILAFGAGIQAQDDLSGTININIKGENQDVWEKMAKEYMKLHPKVKVNVALKPQQGYADFINAGFAAGERYWPDDMDAPQFYQPVPRGLEIRIGEKLEELRRLNEAALAANLPNKAR